MNSHRIQRGVTLTELVIAMAIFGALLVMAAQSFSGWIRNSKVRATAESIQNGLQLARAEAVRRNALVRFQLVTTADNLCQISTTASNWVISLDDPTTGTACATPPGDTAVAPNPRIVQLRPAAEGSGQTMVTAAEWNPNVTPVALATTPVFAGSLANSGWVTFNGLGRLVATTTPATPGSATIAVGDNIQYDVAYATGTCAVNGGDVRCLRVLVSSSGRISLCDPKLASTDAQACSI